MICRCLQALAEALKINASVTTIELRWNDIGDEGAKAWSGVVPAELSLNAAACRDLMDDVIYFDRNNFGWVGGAQVL